MASIIQSRVPTAQARSLAAVDRLADHIRMRALPWPAKRLARRHGLRVSTAGTIAELIGYTGAGR